MPGPTTVRDILLRRQSALQAVESRRQEQLETAQGSLSDGDGQTVSINIPPPAAVLTIVSWNIQTFEAGKSLGNPFVNVVINRVLEELSADICILLETRAQSYINMNAIETGDVGSGNWKAVEDDDESTGESDDDDEDKEDKGETPMDPGGEDNDDDPDTVPDGSIPPAEPDGGEDLRYVQIVSDMTGKRWVPPPRVYVYQPDIVAQAKLVRDFAQFAGLLSKLQEVTGCDEMTAHTLAQAATSVKRTAGKKVIKDFTAKHKVSRKPGQRGRQKTFTDKDTSALLRVYSAFLTDTTRFEPVKTAPDSVKAFAESYHQSPKWLKPWAVLQGDVPGEQWKDVLLSEALTPVRHYYDLLRIDDAYQEQVVADWNDVRLAAPTDNWRYVLRIRRCPGCGKPFGSGSCASVLYPDLTCEGMGALSMPLGLLRESLGVITFYRGAAQESYSLLVRQSTTVTGPSSGGTWLNGKRVRIGAVSSGLLMREPHMKQILKGEKTPKYRSGQVLGYQDGTSTFYGRCPFHVPLSLWLAFTGIETHLPLIAFHGPYGANTNDGVQARADSMNTLMKAAIGDGGTALGDSATGLIMGDFNLDWLGGEEGDTKQNIAKRLYEGFDTLDFKPMIEGGIATSLRSIYGKEQTWLQIDPSSSSNFTSSAYDNLFLKSELVRSHHLQSVVIDVIDWIADNIDDFTIGPDQDPPPPPGFDLLPPRLRAFYIYHRYVSDHLPILCELVVQGMGDESPAMQQAVKLRDQIRQEIRHQRIAFAFNVVMTYEAVLDIAPARDEEDGYTKTDEEPARYGRVVGTVVGHQDNHLLICCSPEPRRDAIWLTFLPERKGKPISGNLLKRFLEFHQPGTRVVVSVLNPKWVAMS